MYTSCLLNIYVFHSYKRLNCCFQLNNHLMLYTIAVQLSKEKIY